MAVQESHGAAMGAQEKFQLFSVLLKVRGAAKVGGAPRGTHNTRMPLCSYRVDRNKGCVLCVFFKRKVMPELERHSLREEYNFEGSHGAAPTAHPHCRFNAVFNPRSFDLSSVTKRHLL